MLEQRHARFADRRRFFSKAALLGELPFALHPLAEGLDEIFECRRMSLADLVQVFGDYQMHTLALPHWDILEFLEQGDATQPRVRTVDPCFRNVLEEILSLAGLKLLVTAYRPGRSVSSRVEAPLHRVVTGISSAGLPTTLAARG